MAWGLSRFTCAMSRPSWNPGRRQGTQTTRSPKHSAVSFSPSAAVAKAIPDGYTLLIIQPSLTIYFQSTLKDQAHQQKTFKKVGAAWKPPATSPDDLRPDGFAFDLKPFEIKTFKLTIKSMSRG